MPYRSAFPLFLNYFLEDCAVGSTWEKAFRQIDFERSLKAFLNLGADSTLNKGKFMLFDMKVDAHLTLSGDGEVAWGPVIHRASENTEKLRVVYKTQASNRQILVQTIFIKRQSDWSGAFFLEDPGLRDSLLNEDLTYIHIMAGGGKIDSEEVLIYEEDLDEGDGTEGDLEESTKLKLFCRLASMASKLREFIGNMITTAGKVVLKILLGSSGMMLPSLTSSVYFFVFLGLCTWWSWCRTFDPLLFSYLCVLLPSSPQDTWSDSICTSSQFFQEAIPHNDCYARLRGIAGHLKIPCTEWWRQILKYFWMSVVICMMPVLIFIHTYQFENFPGLWQNMIGLKKEKLEALGLKQFRVAELFTCISIPTSFLPVCLLHLRYFHGWFLELTNLKSIPSKEDSAIYRDNEDEDEDEDKEGEEEEETSDLRNNWHLVIDHLTVLLLWFLEGFYQLLTLLWWTLELHIIKTMYSCIIWVSVKEASDAALSSGQTQQVSLFNYVFLVSWAFTLPYAKLCHVASSVCTVWTCVIIVCKMLYQLQTIKPENFSVNCSLPNENQTNIPLHQLNKPLLYSTPTDPTERMDLRKSSPLLVHLRNNLLMLAILAFKVTIYCHQEYYQGWNNLSTPVSKTIYHNITRLQLDDGLVNCARYFINYFSHKFGLEIFEDENKAAIWIMAGDNVEICMNLDAASFSQHNPVPDFIHCRLYLDISMVVIFSYPFWFVLTVIFITGMTHISIFCMG
ncbi:hypothetical protein JEQ12_020279 [Ovis aries]|uniref:Piezo non-specific cation channel R-Ras-binding domain-containing protein n=1 Tax=Ovis aries TaxID=9940 RepID=A0A835ZIV2_SHEEP|nr:hypothetical protein JEQ12_020279 [Ovis aries]